MAIRKIIKIDEDTCNGCGLCVDACHEGAIGLIDGKAHLLRDDFCDGFGDCLPSCPQDAISFIEREAKEYDEDAVEAHLAERATIAAAREVAAQRSAEQHLSELEALTNNSAEDSELSNWPIQIKLAPIKTDYFDDSNLLIAADCTSFAYADFHNKFISGRTCLIGCPKLDGVDYTDKLTAIISSNSVRSVTVARMSVPCCGGIEMATRRAIEASGKIVPLAVATISTKGELISIA
jgi:Fe-S-cluster-containing hydrogenase component 2